MACCLSASLQDGGSRCGWLGQLGCLLSGQPRQSCLQRVLSRDRISSRQAQQTWQQRPRSGRGRYARIIRHSSTGRLPTSMAAETPGNRQRRACADEARVKPYTIIRQICNIHNNGFILTARLALATSHQHPEIKTSPLIIVPFPDEPHTSLRRSKQLNRRLGVTFLDIFNSLFPVFVTRRFHDDRCRCALKNRVHLMPFYGRSPRNKQSIFRFPYGGR